jgi:hypothetical protein
MQYTDRIYDILEEMLVQTREGNKDIVIKLNKDLGYLLEIVDIVLPGHFFEYDNCAQSCVLSFTESSFRNNFLLDAERRFTRLVSYRLHSVLESMVSETINGNKEKVFELDRDFSRILQNVSLTHVESILDYDNCRQSCILAFYYPDQREAYLVDAQRLFANFD